MPFGDQPSDNSLMQPGFYTIDSFFGFADAGQLLRTYAGGLRTEIRAARVRPAERIARHTMAGRKSGNRRMALPSDKDQRVTDRAAVSPGDSYPAGTATAHRTWRLRVLIGTHAVRNPR